jgi:phage baseplate assembly protein V
MMHKLLNAQKAHALAAQAGLMMPPHAGIISSYDPVNFAVKVRLQPHDVETGWLPLMSPWVGNGWGMFCAPSLGDLIDVQFLEGSAEVGFACLRWFTDSARPLNVPSGEFWLVHSSGAFFKLTNDGKATVQDKAGSIVVMNGDGTGTMTFAGGLTINANTTVNGTLSTTGKITGGADIQASGNVSDQGGNKTMAGMRTTFNSHTHTDPQGGSTGTPSATM